MTNREDSDHAMRFYIVFSGIERYLRPAVSVRGDGRGAELCFAKFCLNIWSIYYLGYSDSPAYLFVVYTFGMIMLHQGLSNYLGYIRYVT